MTPREIVEKILAEDMGTKEAARFMVECYQKFYQDKISLEKYAMAIAEAEIELL